MAGHVSGAYRGSGKEPEGLLGVDALDRCGDRGEMDTVLPFTCPVAVREPVTQKFVSVECHRIAYAAFPFRDLVQERQGIVICDEDVKPPSTLWVGFQMVQTAIAMVSRVESCRGTPRRPASRPVEPSPSQTSPLALSEWAPAPGLARCGNWRAGCRPGKRDRSCACI